MATSAQRTSRRLLVVATVLYAAGVIGAWIAIRFLGDRWSLPTVLLFGPRWVATAPLVILVPWALVARAPGAFATLVAFAAFVLGPFMDFRISLKALHPEASANRDLRILTHNIDRLDPMSPRFVAILDDVQPDVIALQECIPKEGHPLSYRGYATHAEDQICLLSKYPITKIDSRDRTDVWKRGGSGAIVRYEIALPTGKLNFMIVHLETVREGLVALRHGDFGEMDDNIAERRWESELARDWAKRADGPLIVAGDFNMPIESAIYRAYWSDLTNAFSEAGLGYGTSKETRWFGVRIDHIVTTPGWTCIGAWMTAETGSDHRPLVADFRRAG